MDSIDIPLGTCLCLRDSLVENIPIFIFLAVGMSVSVQQNLLSSTHKDLSSGRSSLKVLKSSYITSTHQKLYSKVQRQPVKRQ